MKPTTAYASNHVASPGLHTGTSGQYRPSVPLLIRDAVLSRNWAGHESERFSQWERTLAREPPATIVPGRETSEGGRTSPISRPSDGRLDPSEAAAGHRLPASRDRVLRERLGTRRLRFTNAERRLLAEKGQGLGRTMLAELATLATPETILRWYRRMIAAKYDGSDTRRSPGRPPTASDVTKQLLTMARESPS